MKYKKFKYIKIIFYYLTSFIFIVSCQHQPTKIIQTSKIPPKNFIKDLNKPIKIKKSSIILDSRSFFEYSLSHVKGAYHLDWRDLYDNSNSNDLKNNFKNKKTNFFEINFSRIAKRLALKGINPDSHIIIIGKGKEGTGDEGKLAWLFLLLGIKNINLVGENYFSSNYTQVIPPQPKNVPFWEPKIYNSLIASKKEILNAITNPNFQKNIIIDVRNELEFLNRKGLGLISPTPNIGAYNIEWTEFINEDGTINQNIKTKLIETGITPNKRIIVLSNKGVRSSLITVALIQMGYIKAGHYIEGLMKLNPFL